MLTDLGTSLSRRGLLGLLGAGAAGTGLTAQARQTQEHRLLADLGSAPITFFSKQNRPSRISNAMAANGLAAMLLFKLSATTPGTDRNRLSAFALRKQHRIACGCAGSAEPLTA
jgi:hypothetical protein